MNEPRLSPRVPLLVASATLTIAAACGGSSANPGSGGSGGGASTSTATSSSSTSSSTTSSSTGGGGSGSGPVGSWTDAPGACPAGLPRVDLHTAAELASASRGEDAYAGDAPGTCYFLHDGTYQQSGVVMYVTKGGTAAARRVFVGESRDGVKILGRASIDDGVGAVTVSNMTFDLTGYVDTGSFNTLSLGNGDDIIVDHVTFTGDCATGLKGGHIETNGTSNVLVEACLIEKFGHCGGGGHEDHGIYLASGSGIVVRNNVVRGNSSRGIQLFTNSGIYGTLADITIEENLIQENGHADYEDGIVVNGADTGTITNLTIRRNVFAHNYYSGIRFGGPASTGVVVTRNTFWQNGAGTSAAGRSEINIDDMGEGAGTNIAQNLFEVGNLLINNCYDAVALGFGFGDNFVHGAIPSGAAAACVGPQTMGDPMLVDPAKGDFHPGNPAAAGYGAYAP